jgi:hypothetical protein
MAEHPIIFSAPMIRAILDGQKTQTRRLLKGKPPKFASGDTLWVRESWTLAADDARPDGFPVYRADGTPKSPHGPWRSPIFMPRWASRIALSVTAARVQRVQDISEADAMAEGAQPVFVPPDCGSAPHVEGFRALWDSIHGDGAWDRNDEVAAYTFTVQAAKFIAYR